MRSPTVPAAMDVTVERERECARVEAQHRTKGANFEDGYHRSELNRVWLVEVSPEVRPGDDTAHYSVRR